MYETLAKLSNTNYELLAYFLAFLAGLLSPPPPPPSSAAGSSMSRHSAALAWPSSPSILARWMQSRTTLCAAALSSMFIHVRMRRKVNTLRPPVLLYDTGTAIMNMVEVII